MVVRQLPAGPITAVRLTMTGEIADRYCDSLRSLSTSFRLRFGNACAPWLTPPCVDAPGVITIMLVPRLLICSRIRVRAPYPTATITITAATPMMMPSMVSAARILFF